MNMLISALLVAGLAGVAVLAAVRVANALRTIRRHRTRANRLFLAGYRAGFRAAHMPASRGGAGVIPPAACPVVQAPAGAARPPSRVTPPGSIQSESR